jgi:hypothetical protein
MNQLPKFVLERLARPGGHPLVHPDADLLTAFVEHKVTHTERDQVFAHLSECSACREVVALAAPEHTAVSVPGAARGVPTWLKWPGMRWVALTTACVVVAAIGISLRSTLSERDTPSQKASEVVREQERHAAPLTDTLRSAEASNASHVTEAKKESAPASTAKKPEPDARNEINGLKSRVTGALISPKALPHPKPPLEKDDARIATFADEKKQSANESVEVTGQSAAVPAVRPMTQGRSVAVGGGIAGVSTTRTDRDQVSRNQASEFGANPQQNKFVIQPQQAQAQGLAKVQPSVDGFKATAPSTGAAPAPVSPQPEIQSQTASSAQVSAEQESKSKDAVSGITLERRSRGRTKAVLPNLGAVGFGGGAPYDAGASPSLKSSLGHAFSWKISPDGKLLRKKGGEDSWHTIDLPSSVTLHSLASNDLDAWVGGAPLSGDRSGALFHTTDGGEHWQRVDGPWTGDILALQASGAQHTSVLVRTAGGEWQTQDAGVNWIRTR